MQHQPSAKMLEAAITSKPDAFLIQNLSLGDSIAGSKFKQFLELIQPTLINRDAKNEYLGKVGVASRGAQTSEDPVVGRPSIHLIVLSLLSPHKKWPQSAAES